jgi:hypothetical protein
MELKEIWTILSQRQPKYPTWRKYSCEHVQSNTKTKGVIAGAIWLNKDCLFRMVIHCTHTRLKKKQLRKDKNDGK